MTREEWASKTTAERLAVLDQWSRRTDWTREDIEMLRGWERPSVRCRLETRDGHRDLPGTIDPDINPWVTLHRQGVGGCDRAELFSWGLVLEVLNDPRAAPLWFWMRDEVAA